MPAQAPRPRKSYRRPSSSRAPVVVATVAAMLALVAGAVVLSRQRMERPPLEPPAEIPATETGPLPGQPSAEHPDSHLAPFDTAIDAWAAKVARPDLGARLKQIIRQAERMAFKHEVNERQRHILERTWREILDAPWNWATTDPDDVAGRLELRAKIFGAQWDAKNR